MDLEDNQLRTRVEKELEESCRVKQQFSGELKEQIVRLARLMAAALEAGRTIYWIGNGGSAADAQHLACELVGRLRRNRKALPAVALTTNTSLLTAVANDFGFEEVFVRQVHAHLQPGDLLIALSTSGASENILRAVAAARELNAVAVGWTGEQGGRLAQMAELCLCVPSQDTQRIQEAHITLGHILCGLVEDLLAPASGSS